MRNHTRCAPNGPAVAVDATQKPPSALDTALDLLRRDFWPIPIYPPGVKLGTRIAKGKEPIGEKWGASQWDEQRLRAAFRKHPKAGVGIGLGPGRGPEGLWLIDLEGDGPRADESLATLFQGQTIATMGWSSTRAPHHVFTADGDRLLELLKAAGAIEGKGHESGKFTLAALPDLEFRIGRYAADGSVLQFQSVVPPTPGTDGVPRQWNGVHIIAELPEAVYATLKGLAERLAMAEVDQADPEAYQEANHDGVCGGSNGSPQLDATTKARAIAFLAKVDPAIEGQGNGQGSNMTFRAACDIVRFGIDDPEVVCRLLWDHYNDRCKPPWSWDELLHKAEEACKIETRRDRVAARGIGPPEPKNGQPEFSNFDEEWKTNSAGERVLSKLPRCVNMIAEHLQALKPDWPKRVNESLFIQTNDFRPVYLNSAARCFAWVDRYALVDWTKGSRYVTQERFYEHLRMNAEQFDAIETLPHWPPMPGIYYMHKPVPDGGGSLDQLIDHFKPASNIDRELIKALILTLFWGGDGGTRPAFIVTGQSEDEEQGRGVGKSKLCQVIATELLDGYVSVSPNDDMADIKRRLLSTESGRKRVVFLDNIKTFRLSWAELEGQITDPLISGHKMFEGDASRPNILIWLITINGATLSKDMAQRGIQIELARHDDRPGWERDTRRFCRTHRMAILGEIRQILMMAPKPLASASRWADWESDIVSKLKDPKAIQASIKARQARMDDDAELKNLIASTFRRKLAEFQHDPSTDKVLITSSVAAQWVEEATRKKYETNQASALLKDLLPTLRKSDRNGERIWLWSGEKARPDDKPRNLDRSDQTCAY